MESPLKIATAEDCDRLERYTPAELQDCPQWGLWRLERDKDGNLTKIPYRVQPGFKRARSTKKEDWTSFQQALSILETRYTQFSGLAFCLFAEDPYTFIDFDHCLNGGKQVLPEFEQWMQRFNSYMERSQGGEGFHILGHGKKPGNRCKNDKKHTEIYDKDRFLAFTADVCQNFDTIHNIQQPLNELYAWAFNDESTSPQKIQIPSEPTLSDQDILALCQQAANASKFQALWTGDTSDYAGDDSSADLALCSLLAFYTQIPDQLDRLFRQSALYRQKWDEKRGQQTYGERTIQTALNSVRETYTPPMAKSGQESQYLPEWCFWSISEFRGTLLYHIDVVKFLAFLATEFTFRVFMKRNVPVIVEETYDGFKYCIHRGTQVLCVKNATIDFLIHEGFPEIASELLLKTRLFSLDVLENLPIIDKEKVRLSIFTHGQTRISLQDEYIDKESILYYQESEESRKIYLLNRHDMGVIVSRQGMGKSTAIELLISQALYPCEKNSPFTFQMSSDEIILHFDTERTHDDNLRMLKRIAKRTHVIKHGLLNAHGDFQRLIVEMCADDVDDIGFWLLEKIESIQQPIGLIVIDTLLDTVPDMNNQELAVKFYQDLRHAAKVRNCAILSTIHASPDSKDTDGKGMGHIGSLFMRKASTFLQVRNAEENYMIKLLSSDFRNAKIRNSPDHGLLAAFTWGEDGLAHFIDYAPPEKLKMTKQEEAKRNYRELLQHGGKTKDILLKEYCEKFGVTKKTAYSHFEMVRKQGWLTQVQGRIHWKLL